MIKHILPTPTKQEVDLYLKKWQDMENYRLQENSLDKLFFRTYPHNKDIDDILVKCSTLNDFYSTNIFSIFPVAKHILSLDIDQRLQMADTSLVNDIAKVELAGKVRNFYSFASKYCSHHQPKDYPIYDSYVEKVLLYFRRRDGFSQFKNADLKDYARFKEIILDFRQYYDLEDFDLKQIDQYIWQLGKDYFPNTY